MSVSVESLDMGFTGNSLVRAEAISKCKDKKWSSFLCVLALSSVVNRNIISLYPDCGELKYKLLFNQQISPRVPLSAPADDLHILFSFIGTMPVGSIFKSNHFVPIVKSKLLDPVTCSQQAGIKKHQNIKTYKISIFFQPLSSISSNKSLPTCCTAGPSTTVPKLQAPAQESNVKPVTSQEPTPVPLILRPEYMYDVAYFRSKAVNAVNESQLLELSEHVFKPDKSFVFPKTNGRSFLHKWFEDYPWLCYSPSLDGAFCLSCVLFGDQYPDRNTRVKKLYIEPMSHWRDAPSCFKRHIGLGSRAGARSGLHESTWNRYVQMLRQASGKSDSIEVMIDEHARKTVVENRKKLVSIVDTIKLCGRQGIALRGHRDDSKYHPEVGSFSEGRVGNFIELLNFRVRAGDKVLEEHLKNAPKNASYISKTTQNELIKSCGQIITDTIINEVKRNKCFSIIADEAADCSNKEQLSLVLRFVDGTQNIREDFVRFLHCKWGLSGESLAKLVLDELINLNLSIDDCRGQGYDGAGSVAGHISGLSARILNINKKALFTHCYNHRLNLAITHSCSVPLVRNTFHQIKDISYFFNLSDTRRMILEKNVLDHCPESQKMKLRDVCRTRWIERVKGMDIFQELFVAIFFH